MVQTGPKAPVLAQALIDPHAPVGPRAPFGREAPADGETAKASTSQKPKTAHGLSWLGVGIRLFILLLIGALVVLVLREWDWWEGFSRLQRTDDAYLQADTTPLAAKVPGYVKAVHVGDFQRVHAGDPIVDIVDDDYRAQLDQAQANVVAAGAAIDNIEQQKLLQETLVKQAEAEIQASEANVAGCPLRAKSGRPHPRWC
jgi:membrane fusion protein (multidrug efflux system)